MNKVAVGPRIEVRVCRCAIEGQIEPVDLGGFVRGIPFLPKGRGQHLVLYPMFHSQRCGPAAQVFSFG